MVPVSEPVIRSRVAKVCRKSFQRNSRMPARFSAGRKTRRSNSRPSRGPLPSEFGNTTRPSGAKATRGERGGAHAGTGLARSGAPRDTQGACYSRAPGAGPRSYRRLTQIPAMRRLLCSLSAIISSLAFRSVTAASIRAR